MPTQRFPRPAKALTQSFQPAAVFQTRYGPIALNQSSTDLLIVCGVALLAFYIAKKY